MVPAESKKHDEFRKTKNSNNMFHFAEARFALIDSSIDRSIKLVSS